MRSHRRPSGRLIVCLCALTAALTAAETVQAPHLAGDITILDRADLSLKERIEEARKTHLSSGGRDYYFTGYIFLSRHSFDTSYDHDSGAPLSFTVKNHKIRL